MPSRRTFTNLPSFGYRPDPHDPRDYRLQGTYSLPGPPARVDHRSRVRTIQDQGSEGACTGFAVCAAAELLFGIAGEAKLDLSERWAYHHARRHDPWPGENYSGSTLRAALEGWQQDGLCEEDFWPFEPYTEPSDPADFKLTEWEKSPRDGADENARRYRLSAYYRLGDNHEIRRAVHENHVALVGAQVHTGWLISGTDEIRFTKGQHPIGLHAFVIVGYDDEEACFHVLNSWGPDWGKDGLGRLGYKDLKYNMIDAWAAVVSRRSPPVV